MIDDGGNAFHPYHKTKNSTEDWEAHIYGHWIKLLNVDKPDATARHTHFSTRFEREWAKERTYHRWEEWGTFYGFSYHSGALLCPPFNEPDDVPLWRHFGTMYFDMYLLLLYVRVTLFRFSTQLTAISRDARGQGDDKIKDWSDKFEALRWQFALFTNLYQFPLISNQQQGLELYSLARKYLDLDDLYKEVHSEIQSSHDFLLQKQQQQQNLLALEFQKEQKALNDLTFILQQDQKRQTDITVELQEEQKKQAESTKLLTVVATIGLIISVALAFFGSAWSSSVANDKIGMGGGWRWLLIILIFFSVFFVGIIWLSRCIGERMDRLAALCRNKEKEEAQSPARRQPSLPYKD